MDNFTGKPSSKFYGLFQYLFDHYNEALFDGQIKDCVIVVTRRKNVMGHFSFKRWFHAEDQDTDELALNPSMFIICPLIEICQTIVHEMRHGWQYHYGSPSRSGYHNREWAEKMIALGLMPTDTGGPGGRTTGFGMGDFPIEGGRFLEVTEELMNMEVFAGLYLEVNPEIIEQLSQDRPLYEQVRDLAISEGTDKPRAKGREKVKYSCGCSNVWGKPGLDLTRNSCGEPFMQKT